MQALIECVPNFSEGRNPETIRQICAAIDSVEGIRLLNVDPGKDTNRSVVTFAGPPELVIEAAFRGISKAAELIDMQKHIGEHPRMGATDVCPLIPLSGISMEETAEYARKLAKRVGESLNIPVYLYEAAALDKDRTNLSDIRSGEYEGFFEKIKNPQWKPDFGPSQMNEKAGATVIGARDFLVAYNINLNTTSVRRANSIAFDVREKGRIMRENDAITGKIIKDDKGEPIYKPGSLKKVKAMGWYIEEYGIAQISMNLTDIKETPVHKAFDEVCKKAEARGIRVTGSELIGLIPLKCLIDAGKHYLKKQRRSTGIPEKELIKIAIKSLGLDDLTPFEPEKRIIEYVLKNSVSRSLTSNTLVEFVDEISSESPAPGGGSVAAYLGALGASLAGMVANLSAHKRGWDERWEEFSDVADKAQSLKESLLFLVEEDTRAFNQIMACYAMNKQTEAEKKLRNDAIIEATLHAINVPLQVMEKALESMDLIAEMAEKGNPNSVSDAGVAALCARSAVMGALLNVKINASGMDPAELSRQLINKAEAMAQRAIQKESEILALVEANISKA